MSRHAPFICTPLVYYRAYNTYLVLLIPGTSANTTTAVRVCNNSIYMTLCTEHFTCGIFGATASAVPTVHLTLTHRYNAVRGHRTDSNT